MGAGEVATGCDRPHVLHTRLFRTTPKHEGVSMNCFTRWTASLVIAAAAVLAAAPADAQDGLTVRQKSTVNMGRLGGGDLQQTVMIRGTDRHKMVTEGRMKVLIVSRDAASTEIVRLDEGQIYTIDTRRKQYTTQGIPELRTQMERSQRDLQAAAAPQANDEEFRMWVTGAEVERSGETRTINGFNTERALMKLTVMGENRRTGEQGPMFHLTADMWIDPSQKAAARVNQAFYRNYVEQLGLDPRSATNPFGKWFQDLYEAMDKIEGYPILTHVVFEAPAQAPAADGGRDAAASPTDPVGAALGGLMRRASRPREEAPANPAATPGRSLLFSSTTEVLAISLDSPGETEFAPPADFRKR
jgi:hypothetical protein